MIKMKIKIFLDKRQNEKEGFGVRIGVLVCILQSKDFRISKGLVHKQAKFSI